MLPNFRCWSEVVLHGHMKSNKCNGIRFAQYKTGRCNTLKVPKEKSAPGFKAGFLGKP